MMKEGESENMEGSQRPVRTFSHLENDRSKLSSDLYAPLQLPFESMRLELRSEVVCFARSH